MLNRSRDLLCDTDTYVLLPGCLFGIRPGFGHFNMVLYHVVGKDSWAEFDAPAAEVLRLDAGIRGILVRNLHGTQP